MIPFFNSRSLSKSMIQLLLAVLLLSAAQSAQAYLNRSYATLDESWEFHGDFVDFDPVWSFPKPSRPAGPPVLIGASSRYVFARIAE